ncbi:MAG: AAA family ATPase [Treponema sp.]
MYETVKQEFVKWVKEYSKNAITPYEITLINLILNNFEKIASKGTAAGARAKYIVLELNKLNFTCDDKLIDLHDNNIKEKRTIKQLKSLDVESFRGFKNKVKFDFEKPYSLFYGPNGSGKSSLCEALEYCLLGSIQEAYTRRIDLSTFIKNNITNKSIEPQLMCHYVDGKEDVATVDYDKYRFSFIEKNRIETFSHLSATTNKDKSERLAALFGLSDFLKFCSEFTYNFNDKIDISQPIKDEYENDLKQIAMAKEELKNKNEDKQNIDKVIQDEIKLLNNNDIKTLDSAISFLQDENGEGKIKETNDNYTKSMKPVYETDWIDTISPAQKQLEQDFTKYRNAKTELVGMAVNADLHDLYKAITNLSVKVDTSICPACKTPVNKTVVNPFENAKNELQSFARYEKLKEIIKSVLVQIKNNSGQINILLRNNSDCMKAIGLQQSEYIYSSVCLESFYDNVQNETILGSQITKMTQLIDKKKEVILKIEEINKENKTANEKNKYLQQVKELRKIYEKLVEFKGRIVTISSDIERTKKNIIELEKVRDNRKKEIELENKKNQFNQNIIVGYNKIISNLNSYIKTLPVKLAENLSEKVTEYYNIMNQDDAEFEKVKYFKLPITENESEKIIVALNDGIETDALQILSEGHVKLLGLAILLAKAQNNDQQFFIFDDIVNAIDDDHRNGVINLLVDHKDFQCKQIILTCHGDNFISQFESELEYEKRNGDVARFVFISTFNLEERGVVFKTSDPLDALLMAEKNLADGRNKDAAEKCRQATECIELKIWKRFSTLKINSEINVTLRAPEAIPDSSSIFDGLLKKTRKYFGSNSKENIYTLLSLLKDKKYNWTLMNKGVHIEKNQPEFSGTDIKKVIEILKKIDTLIPKIKFEAVDISNGQSLLFGEEKSNLEKE